MSDDAGNLARWRIEDLENELRQAHETIRRLKALRDVLVAELLEEVAIPLVGEGKAG